MWRVIAIGGLVAGVVTACDRRSPLRLIRQQHILWRVIGTRRRLTLLRQVPLRRKRRSLRCWRVAGASS